VTLNLTGAPKVVVSTPVGCTVNITILPTSPILAGVSSNFTLAVTPTTVGIWSLTLSIANNDFNNNPYSCIVTGTSGWPPPPAPWKDIDIGTVGVKGNATSFGGTYSVSGSGVDIGGGTAPDSFNFMYQPLTGNGTIIAKALSTTNTSPLSKAGLMIRSDLTVGGSFIFAGVTPTGTLSMRRTVTNTRLRVSGISSTAVDGAYAAPTWLKIVRSGNNFSSYKSHDGVNWVLIETVNQTFLNTIYVGIAVTSRNNITLNTATFSNVTVGP